MQGTVRITPIDKIVIEADSPVLPPEPFEKHSKNNSLYLNYIVKETEIKEISEEEVIKKTTENAYKIYGLISKKTVVLIKSSCEYNQTKVFTWGFLL